MADALREAKAPIGKAGRRQRLPSAVPAIVVLAPVLVAMILAAPLLGGGSVQRYETAVGQQRRITLADGPRALRLPEVHGTLVGLRERLVSGTPVGEAFVRDVAARLEVLPEALIPFADQPLRMFYAKAICSGQLVHLEAGRSPVEVPLAFQSAMAGVMLTAELVCDAGGLRKHDVATKTAIDLTRPLGRRLRVNVSKASGLTKCLCSDRDFVAAFEAKYSAAQRRELATTPWAARCRTLSSTA